ncbi:MAG: YgjP-like metallopeptidase domain-containing protein, partial [Pseudomonadota bacterium]
MNFDLFDTLSDFLAPKVAAPKREVRAAKEESEHVIALDGRRVDYKLVRRRGRRGIGLKVDGMGLTVAASLTTSISAIESMIDQHASWVAKKLGEWSNRKVIPQQWETGSVISFMGESLTLMIDVGHPRASAERAMDHLFVKVKTTEFTVIEKAVVKWMKKQALPYFAQRAFLFAQLHQLIPPRVFLSSANSRWGSCNSRREVRFSWRLIKARPALIDYVVCHEFANLR